MFRNRLPRIIKSGSDQKQKKPGETFKDTATHVIPETGKWPQSMLARWL
jgi:hypothetical protein